MLRPDTTILTELPSCTYRKEIITGFFIENTQAKKLYKIADMLNMFKGNLSYQNNIKRSNKLLIVIAPQYYWKIRT